MTWLWYNYINITMSSIFAQPATTPPPHASVSGMMFPMHSSRPVFKAVHHGSKATKISFNIAKIPQDTNCRKASLRCSETASVWTPKKRLKRLFSGVRFEGDDWDMIKVSTLKHDGRSLTLETGVLTPVLPCTCQKKKNMFHFDVTRCGDLVSFCKRENRPNCTRYCFIYFTSWWLPSSNLNNG